MDENLQDFLRKAAERRRQQQSGGQQPAPPPPQQQSPPSQLPSQQRLAQPRPAQKPAQKPAQRPSLANPPEIEILDAELASQGPLADRRSLSALQSTIKVKSESHLDAHLQEVFDHGVGELGRDSVTDAVYEKRTQGHAEVEDVHQAYELKSQAANPLEFLQYALASKDGIRQAFIFSEIFKSPLDRWDDK